MAVHDLMAECGRCNHLVGEHGRKGNGACSHEELTEEGELEVKRLKVAMAGKDSIVQRAVLGAAVALPGMTRRCDCKHATVKQQPAELAS